MKVRLSWRALAANWRRIVYGAGIAGVAAAAFSMGRSGSLAEAQAAGPPAAQRPESQPQATNPQPPSDYSQRILAYIHGTVPITREDLGEHLIARHGAQKLELLINKRIIEHACKTRGIEVTQAEINAALADDLQGLNVNIKEFVENVLKRYHKTLYEWREDVIRPRLLLTKLCRHQVTVTQEDLELAFEAHHGKKVECRLILWPSAEERIVRYDVYDKIRSSDEEFDRAARLQATASLAQSGGRIPPIGKNTTGNETLERAAFGLRPGELSEIIKTPEGLVVLKCVRHIPPDANVSLEKVRYKLEKEVLDKKVQQKIPEVFAELKKEANPNILVYKFTNEDDWMKTIEREIRSDPEAAKRIGQPPLGN